MNGLRHRERCGEPAGRAAQLLSSWSRNDHEDGGPTIQLPAAEAAAPFPTSDAGQYNLSRQASLARRSPARARISGGAAFDCSRGCSGCPLHHCMTERAAAFISEGVACAAVCVLVVMRSYGKGCVGRSLITATGHRRHGDTESGLRAPLRLRRPGPSQRRVRTMLDAAALKVNIHPTSRPPR